MKTSQTPAKQRIASIDIVRGLVMLIMAIDHTREFFHYGTPLPTDLAVTTPMLFFTRWITHFCAPAFVFLSGISAYLAGTRRTKSRFSAFLIKRGLWLVAVELVLITFALRLDPLYHVFILQVIWVIGVSLILLGFLVWLPLPVIAIIGLVIFFGHNIFDIVDAGPIKDTAAWKLCISGFASVIPISKTRIVICIYALLPWTSVMLMGYIFGPLYTTTFDMLKRRRTLLFSGLFLLLLFVILRTLNRYGDPAPWTVQKTTALTVISYFNVTKYPCSLIYLAMTIGTALLLLSLTENINNIYTRILTVYGQVPFFYYVLHFYLIRLINVITYFASGFAIKDFGNNKGYGYPLWGVYLVWLLVILLLYFPCKWFGNYKRTHHQWWLSYL